MHSSRASGGLFAVIVVLLIAASGVSAHSNLYRADPPPNSQLGSAPQTITLYFTERLEREFSGISVQRADGSTVETPPSFVDADDETIMRLVPGDLPDGLYTVVWRALSAEDGHQTRGSYAFAIGAAAGAALSDTASETIPVGDSAARWLTTISAALLIGGLGFVVFVWQSSKLAAGIPRRTIRLIRIGWLLYGAALVIGLAVYVNVVQGDPIRIVIATRFGVIWLIRLGLWALLGLALWWARRRTLGYYIGLALGAAILYAHSQYSHASAAHDPQAVTLATWLHLLGTALWLGGLIHFFAIIPLAKRAESLGQLTGWFSNMARAALLALIVTGAYSAWLFVGDANALLTTLYGQALLLKLLLIAPLLLIAAINLVWTGRRLRQGRSAWTGRLRGLIGAEVALIAGVLLGAAVMTSTNPARAQAAARLPLPDNSSDQLEIVDGVHVHLSASPGWVGENTFQVLLLQDGIDPIRDASLIRVRFDHQTRNLGQSELRPTSNDDGTYSVVGANVSQPGAWRARVTVQRPGAFDLVTDFTLNMELPPVPPGLNTGAPIPGHTQAELAAGVGLLLVGGFTIGRKWLRLWDGAGIFGAALVFAGFVLIVTALSHPTL